MKAIQLNTWAPLMQSATGGVLTVLGGQITMSKWCGLDQQLWQFTEPAPGLYQIENKATGLVLDGSNGGLYPHSANGGPFQRWTAQALGDGFALVQQASGQVVDGNGQQTYLHVSNGGGYQQWSQGGDTSIDTTAWAPLTQTATGAVVTVGDDGGLSMSTWGNLDDQLWQFAARDGGWYQITNKGKGWCLDGGDGGFSTQPPSGADSQLWQIKAMGKSSFALVQKTSQRVLDGNGTQIYANGFNGGGFQQWRQGARLMEFPRSRPYNQITFAMAHDSHTATHYYRDSDNVQENVDQTQPVSGQLMGGIRAMRVSSGYWEDYPEQPYQVFLQHGDPNTAPGDLLGGFCVFGHLADYLAQVRAFLMQYPDQVVTIIDEGGPDDAPDSSAFADAVLAVYTAAFGDMLFDPAAHGLTVDQLGAGQWPTLDQLTAKGPCVLLFMANSAYPGRKPFVLPAYCPSGLIAMNNYDAYNGDSQLRPTPAASWFLYSDRLPANGKPQSPVWLFNHQFTQSLPGRTESSRAYNKWTVGDLLIEDVIRFWSVTSHKPNLINVDFYQGVWGAHSYLMDVVNTLNRVGSFDEITAQWYGSPIVIADTNGLQIGKTYVLVSVANPANAVAFGSNGKLSLAALNTSDPNQHWRLEYNTSAAGIALVQDVQGEPEWSYLTAPQQQGQIYTLSSPAHVGGTGESGWQIGADGDSWWIRRALDQGTHMEGRGDACDAGTVIETWGWNGSANQHFAFREI